VPKERATSLANRMAERRLATCRPFLREAGYSARSTADRDRLMPCLAHLSCATVDQPGHQRPGLKHAAFI
jgi:hypothetical protein